LTKVGFDERRGRRADATLEEARRADVVVIVGSGIATREVVEDPVIMGSLRSLDPGRQLLAG
jgi:hypothetical protein